MILKILLKIWPALVPLILYLFWIYVIDRIILKKLKKSKIINAEFEEVRQNKIINPFSLKNYRFIFTIYLSLILLIISFLFLAVRTPNIENGKYIPAKIKDGKVISGKIIE